MVLVGPSSDYGRVSEGGSTDAGSSGVLTARVTKPPLVPAHVRD